MLPRQVGVPDADPPLQAIEIVADQIRRRRGQVFVEKLPRPHALALGDGGAQQAEAETRRCAVRGHHVHQEDVGQQTDRQIDRIDLGALRQTIQALRQMVPVFEQQRPPPVGVARDPLPRSRIELNKQND